MLKIDEGREMGQRRHTSRHTSPKDADARHARKATASSSVEGSLPSSLTKVLRLSKNKRSGLKASQEAARSKHSRDFSLRFGSGSAPLIIAVTTAIYGGWSSLPLNKLTANKARPTHEHTAGMPVEGCRLVVFPLYVQCVFIEVFLLMRNRGDRAALFV